MRRDPRKNPKPGDVVMPVLKKKARVSGSAEALHVRAIVDELVGVWVDSTRSIVWICEEDWCAPTADIEEWVVI